MRRSSNQTKTRRTKKLEKATTAMEINNDALRAAEQIKENLAAAMESMVSMYEKIVHESLFNFGLKNEFGSKFMVTDGEVEAQTAVKDQLSALSDYCETEAMPSFEKITTIDLSPLCKFGGPGAYDGVEGELGKRKEDVKDELSKAAAFYRDFSLPDTAGERTEILTAPVLLNPLMEAYHTTGFAKNYMPDWETGGKFLSAMQALRDLLKALESETDELKTKITILVAQLNDNTKLRNEVMDLLKAAKEKANLAADEQKEAEEVLDDLQSQAEEQADTVDRMTQTAEDLYAAYRRALDKFTEVFNAGTIFLQMQELSPKKGITSSGSLKTIRRLN